MNVKELLQTDAGSLIVAQHKALKEFAIQRLQEVIDLLEQNNYDALDRMITRSPAGDGYGSDNDYIDFGDSGLEDIGEVVNKLRELATLMEGPPKRRGKS